MIISKCSIGFSAFMLMNANPVCAKSIRNVERKTLKLGNHARFFQGDKEGDIQAAIDEEWEELDVQQMQMSVPTTPRPNPSPTRPPTRAPTPPPTPGNGVETAAPTRVGQNPPPTRPPTRPPTAPPVPGATPPPTNPPTPGPTPNPTTPPPTGPASLFLDEDDVFDEFSLVECQGDCDEDIDCEFGLICFQRDQGTTDVPGCLGNADQIGDGFDDFCIKPQTDDTLVIAGDEGFPTSAFPLQKCQGDCDTDADCASGLSCFIRTGDEAVPGCIGFGGTAWDYCYDPSDTTKELNFIGLPDPVWDYFSLNQCEGDCDFDSDCSIGLVCLQRDAGDDGVVPSCTGNANAVGSGGEDYCVLRPSDTYLASVYDHFEDSNEGTFPIPLCSGDCDFDSDCEGDLVCYYRAGFDPVPGCVGQGEENFDYCVPPDTPDKALDFVGDDEWNYYELKECQGDCDFDSDCDLGLVCGQRSAGGDGSVPGCTGNANDLGTGSEDFCIVRPSDTFLVSWFDDVDGADFGIYPLPLCAGDCDADEDCESGLVCFDRPSLATPVPGCEGPGEEAYGYCINP